MFCTESEVKLTNSKYHVALTDFGCAIRFNPFPNHYIGPNKLLSNLDTILRGFDETQTNCLAHSGNILLMAPEIAFLVNGIGKIRASDYMKFDLWSAATLTYSLVGMPNPFVSGVSSFD